MLLTIEPHSSDTTWWCDQGKSDIWLWGTPRPWEISAMWFKTFIFWWRWILTIQLLVKNITLEIIIITKLYYRYTVTSLSTWSWFYSISNPTANRWTTLLRLAKCKTQDHWVPDYHADSRFLTSVRSSETHHPFRMSCKAVTCWQHRTWEP